MLYPDASGKGRLHVTGLAVVVWDPTLKFYWAGKPNDPNTCIWTRRTYMKARWNNERLMVHIWSSYEAFGMFNDTTHTFLLMMDFSGYYIEPAGLHYIRGLARIYVGILPTPTGEVLAATVSLYIGSWDPADHFRTFIWQGEETEILPPGCISRRIIHRVTVWPIEWHPTIY